MNKRIKLRNKLTGKFFSTSTGTWDADSYHASKIEKGSVELSVIAYTWDMTHVEEISEDMERGRELLKKAEQMKKNAYLNRATNSRNSKVARMMIGRADALESKALALIFG